MALGDFLRKQFIDVIQWTEPEEGILAYRIPMQDMEIQNGAKLTVRESQMAAFVNEGRMADILGPGLYTLSTQTLPLLTNLMNWDKAFKSPFKSDVYFFSTRLQLNQRWGTANPIRSGTRRSGSFGCVALGRTRTGCRTRARFTLVSAAPATSTASRMSRGSCAT